MLSNDDVKDNLSISGMQVLVATYVRPEQDAHGLYQTDQTREEDKFQGKVGVIIALAPLAFQYVDDQGRKEADAWPDGVVPKIGDWVFYRVYDGFSIQVNKQPCRILESSAIRGIVKKPESVL